MNKKNKLLKIHKARIAYFLLFLIAIITIIYVSFVVGYSYGVKGVDLKISAVPRKVRNTELYKPDSVDFSLFWQAWNKLHQSYYGDLNSEKLLYGSIKGMMEATEDPYTVFLPPSENQRFLDDISGEFSGIGVEISMENGLPTVVTPMADSPAEKAGLKAKDIIISIGGKKAEEMSFNQIIDEIRGEEGSVVNIEVARGGEENFLKFDIVRQKITIPSVTWEKKSIQGRNIFYIEVRQFGDDTKKLFEQAAEEVSGDLIVLDLRNNPGGYLDTAVDLASFFIEDGVIVTEEESDGSKKDFSASRNAILRNYKLAVLINQGSASASEILAGAIKDHKRGKLFGENSFGKGSVQILENLSDGSAVKITIAKWLTPKGNHIDKSGIEPDVAVADDASLEGDEILESAVKSYR